jgi:hypothetical protein
MLDLLMVMFPGGRERTAVGMARLARPGGFLTLTQIVPTKAPESVIEAVIC